MEAWFEAVLLGLVQGLTEFLPISSSAHLVIAQEFLGVKEQGLTLELLLHFGSLLAVFVFYWKDIFKIVKAFFTFPLTRRDEDRLDFKMGIWLLLSTFVTGILYVLFGDWVETYAKNIALIASMLLLTGFFLWWIDGASGRKTEGNLKVSDSLIIGAAQGLALLPGISRSGATVVAGLLSGLDKRTALNYSFILAVPIIGGGAILKGIDLVQEGGVYFGAGPYIVSVIVSFLSALAGIKWFMNLMERVRLRPFAVYCFLVSAGLFIYLLV
ncbi:undecaprenyl-diphosphate phosphatase [Paludifilum halophilum]|uniref:Undecaprenyl-diphosphatase n=1 Tax=Paludifilum halophilum TaxID=1642702 RepID=A0A235B1Q1_9BACL|nr:undecaprenyl-diphosphate phosphatase [Paludifilum halophilum]OYD06172.1 hypothetical protein CHM34_17645 [Paludifilum halophilum]